MASVWVGVGLQSVLLRTTGDVVVADTGLSLLVQGGQLGCIAWRQDEQKINLETKKYDGFLYFILLHPAYKILQKLYASGCAEGCVS